MAKYLLLKHYRAAPAPINDVPMDRWTPQEITAHMKYMQDFAVRLEATGAGGKPLREWIELRPFLAMPPTITE